MELILIVIAWLFGIIMGLYFKNSIAFFVLILIIIFALVKNIVNNKKSRYLFKISRYLKIICKNKYIFIFIIFYLISYFQITSIEKSFNTKYKNINGVLQIVGTIISNPSQKQYKTSYTLQVESINGNKSYKNTKLLLNVKKDKKEKLYFYGNKISFESEFEEPSIQRNEKSFNYKEYLKTKGIYGIVETKASKIKIIKENNSKFILKFANTVTNKIEEQANKLLSKKEAGLLVGILIGSKDNLDEDIAETFRNSNLSHMLAVSGAHVSYIIMGITFAITIGNIGKKKGKIITIIFLLFFILVTKQTPSVTRACLMAIYALLANLLNKKINIIYSLSISTLILIMNNPYCIFDIGFQLSYSGTIGIILFYNPLKQWLINKKEEKNIKKHFNKIKIEEMIILTISANIIIIPIMIFHFNTLSFTFVISNLLATPFMGILILLGFFSIAISFIFYPLAKLLSILLNFLINIFMQIAAFSSKLPFSKILIPTPKLISIILYYCFIFFLVYYKKIKQKKKKRNIEKKILLKMQKITIKKIIAVILILTTISILYKQIPKNLKIHFIDVGQGDSTLVITPKNKTILIDGGGSKEKEIFDIGEKVLLPYLLDKGITKLDYVLISHFDADHVRTEF